jgi:hypothetical protein
MWDDSAVKIFAVSPHINKGIHEFLDIKPSYYVASSYNLSSLLRIEYSKIEQDFSKDDIDVYLNIIGVKL